MPGYSATPLVKKLGWSPSEPVFVVDAPSDYSAWLVELIVLETTLSSATRLAHLFVVKRAELERWLHHLRGRLPDQAVVWVSWPKKSCRVATEVDEQVIRDVALPMGWVDIKVCAVSEVWSGLKLVVRKSERKT